jgi:hypothetical protein
MPTFPRGYYSFSRLAKQSGLIYCNLVLKYQREIAKTLLMGYLRLGHHNLELEYIRALSQNQGFNMTVKVGGQVYYRTAEVCRIVGISRATLFRWLKEDVFKEAKHRDRRGWRLFTEDEVERLKAEANQVNTDQVGTVKDLI